MEHERTVRQSQGIGTWHELREAFLLNLKAAWGRAYVRIVAQNRELSWVFFDVVLPLLAVAAYVFIYKALKAPEEYLGYVVLGGTMTSYWLNVLWSMASQFWWEKERGLLETFLVAPMSRVAILLGMAVGGIYSTTLRACATFFLGILLFHVKISFQWPFQVILVFLLTMFSLYGLGMIGASLFLLFGREAWNLLNLLQEPVYLLSGFYFPVKNLGFWIAFISSLIPATLGLDAARQLLFPQGRSGFLPVTVEESLLLFLGILFNFLAFKALHWMEIRGKKEGRLTLRWQ